MKYIYRISIIFCIFFMLGITNIIAQSKDSSGFRHPLQIQSIGLYSKLQIQGNAADKRLEDDYIRNKNLNVEGEWKAWENISIQGNIGYTKSEDTTASSFQGRDRIGLGIKSAWEFDDFLIGGGLLGFSPNPSQPKTEEINPNLYIIRPYLGMGYKWGDFQIQGELHFQTETNNQFKEKFNEEFRRHYQAGLSLSYGWNDLLGLFLEMETRVPYDKLIDRNSRYASIYPGVSLSSDDWGTLAVSVGFPIIEDRIYDRSARIQYFYFW